MRSAMVALALIATMVPSPASANDSQACDAAYDRAQTLRDLKKLVAAREQLRKCGRATCASFMVKDCTTWLRDVEGRIPSVVLSATDGLGAPSPNVRVTVDHAGPARRLDGTSWDLDPGEHTFTFLAEDGTSLDKTLPVLEGQKDQLVTVRFGVPAPASGPPLMSGPGSEGSPTPGKGFPYNPVGVAVGGLGLVGVIVGSVFGAEALATKHASCTSDGACTGGAATTALNEGTISTVGFVVGGILAAGGLTLVLVAPRMSAPRSVRIEAMPFVASGSDGVMVRWSL